MRLPWGLSWGENLLTHKWCGESSEMLLLIEMIQLFNFSSASNQGIEDLHSKHGSGAKIIMNCVSTFKWLRHSILKWQRPWWIVALNFCCAFVCLVTDTVNQLYYMGPNIVLCPDTLQSTNPGPHHFPLKSSHSRGKIEVLRMKWKWKWKWSHVRLFATPWTVAHQAPPSMDSPGKNTGVGCHFLLPLRRKGLTESVNWCQKAGWESEAEPYWPVAKQVQRPCG